MNIVTTKAQITRVVDLSPTAREVTFTPESQLAFIPGAFVNVFVDVAGTEHRRAFSFSSDSSHQESFTLTIRHVPTGAVSPFFWLQDVVGKSVRLMGPLGKNTVKLLTRPRVFLIGFGVGVSVIKALVHALVRDPTRSEIHIVTANKNEDEVLYKDFFTGLASLDPRVTFRHVISDPHGQETSERVGLVSDHMDGLDFSGADVYLCGPTVACKGTQRAIDADSCTDISYFVEQF